MECLNLDEKHGAEMISEFTPPGIQVVALRTGDEDAVLDRLLEPATRVGVQMLHRFHITDVADGHLS